MIGSKKLTFFALVLFLIFGHNVFAKPTKKEPESTTLKAKKVENVDGGRSIIAEGDVEATRGERTLNAEKVVYDKVEKDIRAESEVVVRDRDEQSIFFAERAKVKDDLKEATFYNGGIIFRNGSHILSPYIKRFDDQNFQLDNAKYAMCPSDAFNMDLDYNELMENMNSKKSRLFSMTSSKVDSNIENRELGIRGSTIWFWKIPVFYIPYLKSGFAFEQRVNGFDFPGIEKTNHYGYGIYLPFNYRTDTQFLRLVPKIYEKGNYLLDARYDNFRNLEVEKFSFRGEVTNDNGQSKDLTNADNIPEKDEGYKKWRGYGRVDGYKKFNDIWHFNFIGYLSADRYYMRDYTPENPAYFESNFSLSAADTDNMESFNHMTFDNLFYQDLLEKPETYRNARYAPTFNMNNQGIISKSENNNLFYNVKTNATGLYRSNGLEYNRFTITPSIGNSFNDKKLGLLNLNLNLRGDIYVLNNADNSTSRDGDFSRVFPEFDAEYRKNFSSGSFFIQPILKYTVSPHSENFERKIPNEDSEFSELSFMNIFTSNRFAGYDRTEYGSRFSYGFESGYQDFNFGLAQGYRDNNGEISRNRTPILGFKNDVSDYVGYASYNINDNIDLYYRFRADKDNFSFQFNEFNLNVDYNYFGFYVSYIDIKPNFLYDTKQNQIGFGGDLTVYKNWKISAASTIDIENDNRLLETKLGLKYDGGCTLWEINFRDYNPITETDRFTSWNFNFQVKFLK